MRQALRKLLTERLAVQPVEVDGKKGVRFTGPGSFAKLLAGEGLPLIMWCPRGDSNTRHAV